MELYKILLVDDEEDVRESIARKIDWAELGFTVSGQAGSGEEALELSERIQPDVLMTDIKMPFMDGLELCRRIKKLIPGIRIAIFSGFDEFEYAREAITHQVEEYILKPIDAQELTSVFLRIRETMDAEIAQRRDLARLRRHYEKSLPLMQQQTLIDLLESRINPRDIPWQISANELELQSPSYCAAVIQYHPGDELLPEEVRLLDISLCQLIRDTLGESAKYHLIQRLDHIALLFLLDGQTAAWVMELLNPLFTFCRKFLNIRISIGIGHTCDRLSDVAVSYAQARGALEYRMIAEQGQCIFIGDMEPRAAESQFPDSEYADELLRQIRTGSAEDLSLAVKRLTDHLNQLHTGSQQVRGYYLDLLAGLLRHVRTYFVDDEAATESLMEKCWDMPFSDIDEFGGWLGEYCENLRLHARRERTDSLRQLIERTTAILKEQYADSELSLESVCTRLNVSTAYLSTVFKREKGQGFVSYLTDLRMEKALELLTTTDRKTYQIAQETGYTDPNYFSYVFKRKHGVSPTKYRLNWMSENES